MGQSRETAFHAITSTKAAGFMEEAGWLWVTNYGDVDAEYRAVRGGVGMWDLSPLNKWEFRGSDALEAAQRVHTNDILGMRDGRVRYGPFVDEDGLVVDDGTVFRHSAEHLWVCTNGDDRAAYFADATKGLEVEIAYIAPELPSLQIQGPQSRDLVRSIVSGADVDDLRYFTFFPEPVTVGGAPVWLSRTGFSGELGYELFLRPEHAAAVWTAVEDAGATPYGVDIIEPVRVETGMIVTDYDYEPHRRTPFDLGLDRFVALDAHGDFMGKDQLRAVAADPPNRFVTIRLQGEALPEYGATVTIGGQEAGVLTSPATSPLLGPLGLAIVRTDVAAPGRDVEVALPDGSTIGGTIDVLAVYDPTKERPRA
ncbi:MAG: aminomethyltransferase family protein [Actinomycetota bacterium]|nr:aminomethyltransferase family protein [Actinomycetota bacterium]MDH5313479.1 aminomethyltransferase family protein [Actinomycetota bacterium]